MKNIKNIQYYYKCIAMVVLLGSFSSCSDMLVENPQSSLVPSFFREAQGIESAVIALYSQTRGFMPGIAGGTDDMITTRAMSDTERAHDYYDAYLSPSNSPGSWSFSLINNCNGILEFGAVATGITEARRTVLLAEAKFFRALYYFRLVQSFGPVPLDLGQGKLRFNDSPSTTSVRNPISEVYEAIIDDLEDAIVNLPINPAQQGRATQKVALHLLSKVYLTRAYSDAKQTNDFAKAFEYADALIANKATHGVDLLRDYGMVHSPSTDNDANHPEVLMRLNYKPASTFGGSQSNSWLVTAGYENCMLDGIAVVRRSIPYQRPWRMYAPTPYVLFEAFADKNNDSRFDNSFRMVWICNNDNATLRDQYGLHVGDPGILLYFDDSELAAYNPNIIKFKVSELFDENRIYKGPDVLYMYPNLVKFDDVANRVNQDETCYRPIILFRFAETYLLAAEALIGQNRKSDALPYINAVRTRAAYRPSLSADELAAAVTAMTITDPDLLDVDFILDERTREFYGEAPRWFELTRTGKLIERVQKHNPHGGPNIKPHHVLRPIPQTQLDLMSDEDQKRGYQNPGYPGHPDYQP